MTSPASRDVGSADDLLLFAREEQSKGVVWGGQGWWGGRGGVESLKQRARARSPRSSVQNHTESQSPFQLLQEHNKELQTCYGNSLFPQAGFHPAHIFYCVCDPGQVNASFSELQLPPEQNEKSYLPLCSNADVVTRGRPCSKEPAHFPRCLPYNFRFMLILILPGFGENQIQVCKRACSENPKVLMLVLIRETWGPQGPGKLTAVTWDKSKKQHCGPTNPRWVPRRTKNLIC